MVKRSPGVVGLVALVLAACSSGSPAATSGPTTSSSTGATPGATAAASVGPLSTAPASFQLSVAGDANVTGTWSPSFGITCDNPTFSGLDIIFFAQSPDAKAVVLITLTAGSIGVSERAGAGTAYTDREFTGGGVTSFDPARGGSFDSDLTIIPTPAQNPGTLGTITHIAGSIDCGNQLPGSSTVVASGSSAEGTITGPFTSVRVQCNSSAENGQSANVSAILGDSTPPVFLILNLPANGKSTVFAITESPDKQHSYAIDPAGTLAITATGAHLDADYVEVLAAGAAGPPHKIHLAGDVSCGTFYTS